jgi:hypothetical protein
LLITVGLILGIVGGTSGTVKPDGTLNVPTTSKVGIVLYIVAFVGIVLVYAASALQISVVPDRERRVPIAIILALPFVLVRLVYSALSVFVHSHLFGTAVGNVVVRVTMAIVEEFVVVAIYITLGYMVSKLDARSLGPIVGRPWKGKVKKSGKGISSESKGAHVEERMYEPHYDPLPPSSHAQENVW